MMLRGTVASVHGRNEPFVRVVFKGGQLLLDVIKGFFEENVFRSARVDVQMALSRPPFTPR